jgi:glycerate-2-kinase
MAIELIEAGLAAADPYAATCRTLQRDGSRLRIGGLDLDLARYDRVFLLGAGKASGGLGRALEQILGDRLAGGLFVLRHGDPAGPSRVEVVHAGHPLPDENSCRAARALLDLAGGLTERDLVLAGITGGSSALLCLPVDGVTLQDKQLVNQLLLLSGADIFQINAVRKHLSRIKGGWLAKAILPATLVNLTVSDVVGDALDYITDPTVPDSSTFDDARKVLDEYDLWERLPPAAAEHLRAGAPAGETPKSFAGLPLHSLVVVPGEAACLGAQARAEALGLQTMILTTRLEGEAREAGGFLASLAHDILAHGRPLAPPCAVLMAGENVVSIGAGRRGLGGPNQEFALAAGLKLGGLQNVLVASVDTDGSDGPTEIAGAMVDGSLEGRASAAGFQPGRSLKDHDASRLLRAVGDAILTGGTGTNVNDLQLLLVGPV